MIYTSVRFTGIYYRAINRMIPGHEAFHKNVLSQLTDLMRSNSLKILEASAVVGIVCLLTAVFAPFFWSALECDRQAACITNLKQINGAKATWAFEFAKNGTNVPTSADIFGMDKYIRNEPTCPSGGTIDLNSVDKHATCSKEGHVVK